MHNTGTSYTDLMCSSCGNITTIQRINGRRKDFGHVKDLWCYRCKEETKHIELNDKDITFSKIKDKLTSNIELTDTEKIICKFISDSGDKSHVR